MFAAASAAPKVGFFIEIPYPPDWDAVGFPSAAVTRRGVGELALSMGGSAALPPWIGGELLCGQPDPLRALVSACELLGRTARRAGGTMLPTEAEQTLTLIGALGRAQFEDLSHRRAGSLTGPRHGAPPVEDPLQYGLWHLPSEKGLKPAARGQRAKYCSRGDRAGCGATSPIRCARRAVSTSPAPGSPRRVRDDGWLAPPSARAGRCSAPFGSA